MGAPLEHPSSSSYPGKDVCRAQTLCFLATWGEGSSSPPYPELPITDDPSSRVGCEPSFPPHATDNTNSRQQRCQHVGSPDPGCHVLCRAGSQPSPRSLYLSLLFLTESLGGGVGSAGCAQVLGPGQLGAASGRASGKGTKPWGRSSRLRSSSGGSELGRTVAAVDRQGRLLQSWSYIRGKGGGQSYVKE